VQIQDACAKLLIIFVKFYFGIFLRCQAKVLLSTCPFSPYLIIIDFVIMDLSAFVASFEWTK
jgi:hypothetical protein